MVSMRDPAFFKGCYSFFVRIENVIGLEKVADVTGGDKVGKGIVAREGIRKNMVPVDF